MVDPITKYVILDWLTRVFWQVILDATGSRDPDFLPSSENDAALILMWECTTQRDATSQACTDKDGMPLPLPSAAALFTLSAGTLAPSTESAYLFKVTVSKTGRMPQSFVMPVRTFACFTLATCYMFVAAAAY